LSKILYKYFIRNPWEITCENSPYFVVFERVIKVAKALADSGRKLNFAVSNAADMSHEITEFGLTYSADKPVVTGRDAAEQKFPLSGDFRLVQFVIIIFYNLFGFFIFYFEYLLIDCH